MVDAARDLTGMRLGGLLLEKQLGVGGFGAVYLGKPDVGPSRAVKVLHDKGLAEALRREAEALVSLKHPRIVEFIHADLSNDPPFLVMELVGSGSLAEWIPFKAEAALPIVRGILEGLAHAHSKGIAHLDLKPHNILIAEDGPKIADFGLARAIERSGKTLAQSHSSSAERAAGTIAYMSPEQREGKAGDCRADVFSFGVLLCHLLTGRLPQPGDTLADLLGAPAPAWAEALFARSHCRYEKRFTDAGEMLSSLAVAPTSTSAPPTTQPAAGTAPLRAPSQGERFKACPHCNGSIPRSAKFCAKCGRPVADAEGVARSGVEAETCLACGRPVGSGLACAHCGLQQRARGPIERRPGGVRCKVCEVGSLERERIYRASTPVVLIGWILLLPSLCVLGVLGLLLLMSLLGTAGSAVKDDSLAAGAGVLFSGVWCCMGISAFVSGLLGWLLVMKRDVLLCRSCGATIEAA